MNQAEATELYRRIATIYGKQGGRPRTILHDEEDPRCSCADCRNAKAKVAKKRVKKEAK